MKHLEESINAGWLYSAQSVCKVKLLQLPNLFYCNVWSCMGWTDPFKCRWSSWYACKTSFYFIIESNLSTNVVIFFRPWLCVWGVWTIIFCQLFHLDYWKLSYVSITTVQSMMCANNWVHYDLKVAFACLNITFYYYHHCVDMPESIGYMKCSLVIFCKVCVWSEIVFFFNYVLYDIW